MWKRTKYNGYQIHMSQLMMGVSKDFMFEIMIPPVNFKLGDHERNPTILNAKLEITSADDEKKVH